MALGTIDSTATVGVLWNRFEFSFRRYQSTAIAVELHEMTFPSSDMYRLISQQKSQMLEQVAVGLMSTDSPSGAWRRFSLNFAN